MSEEDFKKLDAKKKVELINTNLSAGMSFRDIYDATMQNHEFAKSRETLLNQFRKAGYLVDRESADPEHIEKPVIRSESPEQNQIHKEKHARLERILESADAIIQMLDWWKSNNGKVPTGNDRLNVDIPNGEELRKTIRINAQIWDQWKAFCGKHPSSSEKDLLAKAMLVYINTEQ